MKLRISFIFVMMFFMIFVLAPIMARADTDGKINKESNTKIASADRGEDPLGRKSAGEISLDKSEKAKQAKAKNKRIAKKVRALDQMEGKFANLTPIEKKLLRELPYEVRLRLKNIPRKERLDWLIDRVIERKSPMVKNMLMKNERFRKAWENTPPEEKQMLLKRGMKAALKRMDAKNPGKYHEPKQKGKMLNQPKQKIKMQNQGIMKQRKMNKPELMRKEKMKNPGMVQREKMQQPRMMQKGKMQHQEMLKQRKIKKPGLMKKEKMKQPGMMRREKMRQPGIMQKGKMQQKGMIKQKRMQHRGMMMQQQKGKHPGMMKMKPEMREKMMQGKGMPPFMNPQMRERMIKFMMDNPDKLRMIIKNLPPEFKNLLRRMLNEDAKDKDIHKVKDATKEKKKGEKPIKHKPKAKRKITRNPSKK